MNLHETKSPIDLHTPAQRAYLADVYENCKDYTDGYAANDAPLPVSLSWDPDAKGSYTVRIGENPDLSDARIYTTDVPSLDVYNLKIGTRYYWTVGNEPPATFFTFDAPPRNLSVGGVINVRDLGGWKTESGRRAKQGPLYRTSALDYYSENERRMKPLIDADGIKTLKDTLGIKTEIDLRVDHEGDSGYPPEGKTESVLGADVRYLHCPILLGAENYLDSVDSLRTVFRTLAEPGNYPVAYHCAVGADRTGFVSYLLLALLGVPDVDIMRDYMWTNFSNQQRYRRPISVGYKVTIDETPGDALRDKVRRVLTGRNGVPEAELDLITAFLTE